MCRHHRTPDRATASAAPCSDTLQDKRCLREYLVDPNAARGHKSLYVKELARSSGCTSQTPLSASVPHPAHSQRQVHIQFMLDLHGVQRRGCHELSAHDAPAPATKRQRRTMLAYEGSKVSRRLKRHALGHRCGFAWRRMRTSCERPPVAFASKLTRLPLRRLLPGHELDLLGSFELLTDHSSDTTR